MSAALRVLVLGTALAQPPSGVRRHAAELLPRVARLLELDGGGLAVLIARDGLPIALPESVERIPADIPASPATRRALAEPGAVRRALERARSDGRAFDLVHTGHLPPPSARALGETPLSATIHDLRRLDAALSGRWRSLAARWLFKDLARRAARLVFVSDSVREAFVAHSGLARARTAVVSNAGDHLVPPASTPPPPEGLPPGYLLHVGHLEPRKNVGLLLEALALDETLPALVLAGADVGGEGRRLAARARELDVEARVHTLGRVDESALVPLYLHAACVVLPSRLEGFGLAAEEARRLGVRLAVADAGALPEVAGVHVPTFDPDDPAGLLRAVRVALEGPPPPASHRSWDASAEHLVQVWRDAVADRR